MPVTSRIKDLSLSIDIDGSGGIANYLRASYPPHATIAASYGPPLEMAKFLGSVYARIMSWDGQVAWIDELGVIPEKRQRGIGTKLLKEFLGLLRDRGVRVALLMATPERAEWMPDLLRFYERAGFSPVSPDAMSESSPVLYQELAA